MSLSTFRLAEVVTGGEITKAGDKISAVAVYKSCVYIGTKTGNVYLYMKASANPSASDQSASSSSQLKAESKDSGSVPTQRYDLLCTKSIASKKPIEKLIACASLGILIVLCDGKVTFHELLGLKRKSEKDEVSNAGIMCVDHTTQGRLIAVTHSKKKKLMLYCHSPDKDRYELLREFAIPDTPLSMVWTERTICLGYRRAYTLMAVEDGAVIEIAVPLDGAYPCMVSVASNELLVTREDLGFFMLDTGDLAARNSVTFRSPPKSLSLCGQYVVALAADGGVDIIAHVDSRLIQSVSSTKCPGLHTVNSSADVVVLCSEDRVYTLSLASLEEQVTQYIDRLLIDQAVGLMKRSPRVTDADIDRLHLRAAVAHLYALRFRAAFAHFLRAKTPPALVLELFPDLPLRHSSLIAERCNILSQHMEETRISTGVRKVLRLLQALQADDGRTKRIASSTKYIGYTSRDPFFPPEGVTMWDIIRVGRARIIRGRSQSSDDSGNGAASSDEMSSSTSLTLSPGDMSCGAFSYPIHEGLPVSGLYAYSRLALAKDFLWRLRQALPSLPSYDPSSNAPRPTLVEQLDYALLILSIEAHSPSAPIFLHPESRNTPKRLSVMAGVGEKALYVQGLQNGGSQILDERCEILTSSPVSSSGVKLSLSDRVLTSHEVTEFLLLHDDALLPTAKATQTLFLADASAAGLISWDMRTDCSKRGNSPRPLAMPSLPMTMARIAVHDILRFIGPEAIALPFDTGLTSSSLQRSNVGGTGARKMTFSRSTSEKSQPSKSKDVHTNAQKKQKWPWSLAVHKNLPYVESNASKKRRLRLKRMYKIIEQLSKQSDSKKNVAAEALRSELAVLIASTEEELEISRGLSKNLVDGSDEGWEDPKVVAENNLIAGYVPDDRTVSMLTLASGSTVPLSPFSPLFHSKDSSLPEHQEEAKESYDLRLLTISSAAFRHCNLPFNARDVVFKATIAATSPLTHATNSLSEAQTTARTFSTAIGFAMTSNKVIECMSLPPTSLTAMRRNANKTNTEEGTTLLRRLTSIDLSVLTPWLFFMRQHMLVAHTLFSIGAYLRAGAILVQGQEQAQLRLQSQMQQSPVVSAQSSPLGELAKVFLERHDEIVFEALCICVGASCGDFPKSPRDALAVAVTPWVASALGASSLQNSSIPLVVKRHPLTQYSANAATVDTASYLTLLRHDGVPKTPVISGALVLSPRDIRSYNAAVQAASNRNPEDADHCEDDDEEDDEEDYEDEFDDNDELVNDEDDLESSDKDSGDSSEDEENTDDNSISKSYSFKSSSSNSFEFIRKDVDYPRNVNNNSHPFNQYSMVLSDFSMELVQKGLELMEGDVTLLSLRIQCRQRVRARLLNKLIPGVREGLHTLSQQPESELLWCFLPWLSLCVPVDAARALITSSHKLGPKRQLHPIKAVLVLRASQLVTMKYYAIQSHGEAGLEALNPIEGVLNRAYQACASNIAPLVYEAPLPSLNDLSYETECLLQGVPARVPITNAVASAEAVISVHVAPLHQRLVSKKAPKFRLVYSNKYLGGTYGEPTPDAKSPALSAAVFAGADAALNYLEHVVGHTDMVSSTSAVHNLLAQNYLTTLTEFFGTRQQLVSKPDTPKQDLLLLDALIEIARSKFRLFLQQSSHYDVPALVAATSSLASELVAERIILNAKAGQHAEVLRTYLLKLDQPKNAESYCTYVLGTCAEHILAQQRLFHQQQLEQEKQESASAQRRGLAADGGAIVEPKDERVGSLNDPINPQDINVVGTLIDVILSPEYRSKFPLHDSELADDARRAAAFREEQARGKENGSDDEDDDDDDGDDSSEESNDNDDNDDESSEEEEESDDPEVIRKLLSGESKEDPETAEVPSSLLPSSAKHQSWRVQLLSTLDKFAPFIDPLIVAAKVPPEVPLDLLLPYFEATLGEIDLSRRSTRLARALSRMLFLRTKLDLLRTRSTLITLTNENCCPECLKPLGDKTVLVVIALSSLMVNNPNSVAMTAPYSRGRYVGLPGHVAAAVAMMRHKEFGEALPHGGVVQNACGILVTNTADHVVVHHNCIKKFIRHVQAKMNRL